MLIQLHKLPLWAYFCSTCIYRHPFLPKNKWFPSILTYSLAVILTSSPLCLFVFSKLPVNVESQLPFIHPKASLMHGSGNNVPSQKESQALVLRWCQSPHAHDVSVVFEKAKSLKLCCSSFWPSKFLGPLLDLCTPEFHQKCYWWLSYVKDLTEYEMQLLE